MRIFIILFLLFAKTASAAPDALNEALRAEEAGDDAKAATLFLPLATKGDPVAQYNLGVLYTRGLVIQKDYRVAVQWYLAAAGQGHAQAETNLALLYEKGEGVAQDYKKAMHWSILAAKQGNASAQLQIGEMHAAGLGVPQNYKEAIKWYRQAADQGNAIASAKLGESYEHGLGVAQDSAAAAKWFGSAANNASDENSRASYLARRDAIEKASHHQTRIDAERAKAAEIASAEAARIKIEQAAITKAAEEAREKAMAQSALVAQVQAKKLADIEKELAKLKAEQSAKEEHKATEGRRRSELEIQMAKRRAEINAEAARRRSEILAADKHAKAAKTAVVEIKKQPVKQPIADASKHEHSPIIKTVPAKNTHPAVISTEQEQMSDKTTKPDSISTGQPLVSGKITQPAINSTGKRQVSGKITSSNKIKYPAKTELTDEELKHPLIHELQPSGDSIPGKPLIKIKQIEWSKKPGDS